MSPSMAKVMGSFEGPFERMGITDENHFGKMKVNSPMECAKLCMAKSDCRSFDYGARGHVAGECWLSRANRKSAGNLYTRWEAYDYYERKTDGMVGDPNAMSGNPNAMSGTWGKNPATGNDINTATVAPSKDKDGSPVLIIVAAVGGAIILILLGVLAVMCSPSCRSRRSSKDDPARSVVVLGQPVGAGPEAKCQDNQVIGV